MFSEIIGQPEAVSALRSAIDADRVAHAYLFAGPAGLGKVEAARSLAQALLCPQGGCGTCSTCRRIARGTYPDFSVLEPEGVEGYLVSQVRDLLHEAALAPREGTHKFFILLAAETLHAASKGSAANALLKLLEEPPQDVTFILITHNMRAMLPTILSRCLVIRFRPLALEKSLELLREATGATADEARTALASTGGSVGEAKAFLMSPARRATREEVVRIVRDLHDYSDREVLRASQDLRSSLEGPLEELRQEQEAELTMQAELLDKVALRKLEQYNKKRLTAAGRQRTQEVFSIISSMLRDMLCVRSGASDQLLNVDSRAFIERSAPCFDEEAARKGQDLVMRARRRLSGNVSPQLVLEALLFDMREVLQCL